MQDFIAFFEDLNSVQKLTWVIACLSVFWVLEGVYPLFNHTYKKWKHAKLNLVLLATTLIINVLFGLIFAGVFNWVEVKEIGLLHQFNLNLGVELIIAVVLLDFIAQYGVHYILHKVPFLWRLHMVHHSDTSVDVTSGTRHHPGDYMFRELFSLLAVIIGGIPFAFYMFYRILTVLFTYWTHANIKLPLTLDKAISYVFVTPNLHKFHHHFERPWTDTNFGNILSIWDRFFGTLVYKDVSDVKYGLDVADNSKSNDIKYQLTLPFNTGVKTDKSKV